MTLSPVKCLVSDTNRQLNVKQAIFYYLCCDTIMTVWKLNVRWAYSTLWISLNFCSLVSLNLHCGRDLHVCPVLKVEKWFQLGNKLFQQPSNSSPHTHAHMHDNDGRDQRLKPKGDCTFLSPIPHKWTSDSLSSAWRKHSSGYEAVNLTLMSGLVHLLCVYVCVSVMH